MTELETWRTRFRSDLARYEKLATAVERHLIESTRGLGLAAEVTARAKEEPNFLRKALKKQAQDPTKYADPFLSIHDRAGARVVVPHRSATTMVRDCIEAVDSPFEVVEVEDTRERYAPNELGYLGVHYLVCLRASSLDNASRDLEGLICEVQLHTKAQSAWSTVSHPLLYKPADGEVPVHIARRINRSIALIDLFDDEIELARSDLVGQPGYVPAQMLETLQTEFMRLSPVDFDPELSLAILSGIQDAYTESERNLFAALMSDFVDQSREAIAAIYAHYQADPGAHPLLFQPEGLAIYERLLTAPARLESVWASRSSYSVELLDSLRPVLGV